MFDSYSNPLYISNSHNNCGICMPNPCLGCSPFQWYQPCIYDQLWINNSWYSPRNAVYTVYRGNDKNFEARKLRKSRDVYSITERNGREVRVGKMRLKNKFIVNQKPDGTFDALYCICECEGNDEPIPIVISYNEFVHRNILPCIPFFTRNEDCPDRYIVEAFFRELLDGDDIKFLQLPKHSGWQESGGNKTSFASSEIVIPQLEKYYPDDILERKLVHTDKKLAESAESLAKLLPAFWKYKFLLSVRITGLLLYFYGLAGLESDQMFIVEPKSESNAKAVTALVKNKNFSPNICPLTDNKTNLQRELNSVNDGIALFRDSSYVEEHKKRSAGLNVLLHDLYNCTGNEVRSRHLTLIISDNPGNISSEFPAFFISLSDCPDIGSNNEIQQAIGKFESALIRIPSNLEITDNLVTNEMRKTACLTKTSKTSEYHMTLRMLLTTVELLCDYRLISFDEEREIINYLKRRIESISVYSFTKDILTPKCMEMINALAFADSILKESEFPKGFIPIALISGCNGAAGVVITDETDESESMYISGQTRSGKTHFLVQQAVKRAESGKKIIIFDQTGAFSQDELNKHLSPETVNQYFSFWDISKHGIPIDLMSLENCSSLPDKKNRLFSIFSVAARLTGDIQSKVLKKRLSDISKAIDAGRIHSLPETLEFFDEQDPEQVKIRDRLEEVFDDLDGLNTYEQNWGEFLNSQKKIVVISTSADGIRKSSQLIDMMLASLYEYKQHDRYPRYTVILDEIEDLCLEKDGPISTILRKGGKHHLSMLLASQEFSVEKDKLGKIIGNCGTLVFFRPKSNNISDISKLTGIDKTTLANLEQGQCVVYGLLYNKNEGRNKHTTIMGWTYRIIS